MRPKKTLPQDPSICSDSSHGNSDVVINTENLLLVRWKLRSSSLQGNQDSVVLRLQANRSTSQLHSFHCILNLMNSTLWTPHSNVAVILIAKLQKEYPRWLVFLFGRRLSWLEISAASSSICRSKQQYSTTHSPYFNSGKARILLKKGYLSWKLNSVFLQESFDWNEWRRSL